MGNKKEILICPYCHRLVPLPKREALLGYGTNVKNCQCGGRVADARVIELGLIGIQPEDKVLIKKDSIKSILLGIGLTIAGILGAAIGIIPIVAIIGPIIAVSGVYSAVQDLVRYFMIPDELKASNRRLETAKYAMFARELKKDYIDLVRRKNLYSE